MRRLPRVAIVLGLVLGLGGGNWQGPVLALAQAQDAATPVAEGVYADPSGRFTVPVPTNWALEEKDGYVFLTDPERDLTIAVVVVEAEDAEAGIAAAWAIADPAFDVDDPRIEAQTAPAAPGVDETVVLTLVDEAGLHLDQAYGQRIGDTVYVLLFSGSLEAAARRQSQIAVVAGGFRFGGVTADDLTGAAPARFEGRLVDELEMFAEELLQATGVPGAAIAVVQGGQIVYARGFGITELGGSDEVTPETLMMIGSTTKSMTTMMMASEVDDGLMRWDEPVVEILPSFAVADPALSAQITVRDLVCACTGVPRRDLEWVFNASELTAEEIVESLREFQFFTGFGEAFQYSNQMVATGGYVAAVAGGGEYGDLDQAYAEELQERVLDPIGMERTTLSFEEVRVDGDRATPHGATLDFVYEPLPLAVEEILAPIAPAGGIWSCANEMARYIITQLNRGIEPDGSRVVSAANLEETWRPQVAVDAETSYGLGWLVGEYKGLRVIAHGGNTFGFTSDLAFLPDAGIGIVVLTNAQGTNLFNESVRVRLLELLYGQPNAVEGQLDIAFEEAAESVEEVTTGLEKSADEANVAPFLGQYENAVLGEIELRYLDGQLILDAGEFQTELWPRTKAAPTEPGYLMAQAPVAGLPVVLRLGDDGRPEVVLDITTDRYVFELVEMPGATPEATPITRVLSRH